VAGVHVLELARREIEAGGEHGHEHGALVVARELPVHARDGLGDRRRSRSDGAEKGLGHRHEERCADALARHVAHQQPDLERSIGRTGLLAMKPILRQDARALWQVYLLEEAGRAGSKDPGPR
jgi:hypothetical protein